MIKKIATIMALALSVSMIGMVPALAGTTTCNFGGEDLAVTLDASTGSIGVADDGKVFCNDGSDVFGAGSANDTVEDITVTGTGTLVLVLVDDEDDAADWSDIDNLLIDIDGNITFEGSGVDDGNLSVRVTDDEVSFLGISGDYDDSDVDTIFFNDGEGSDTFDASGADVEVEVALSNGGSDVVRGGDDDDLVTLADVADHGATIFGNGGDDTLVDLDDDSCSTFYGGSGNDNITMEGNSCDTAFPGSGNDDLNGASVVSYADLFLSVSITDNGDDSETGLAAGDDNFDTAPDVFIGTSRGDLMVGGRDGEATLYAGAGNDTVYSYNSNRVYGGLGDDLLIGSDYTVNYLFGNAGADTLRGRGGNDYLYGGKGLDTIYGGRGRDLCGGEVVYACEFVS